MQQFRNIEHARPGRSGSLWYGHTPAGRVFKVFVAPLAAPDARWRAKAITPRDGMVNELTAPTLAAISEQLGSLP